MSNEPNDGGPAFPFTPNEQQMLPNGTWDQNTEFGDPGMSLRDWFAGMAVSNCYVLPMPAEPAGLANLANVAEWAYQIADEMLKARQQPAQQPETAAEASISPPAPGNTGEGGTGQ